MTYRVAINGFGRIGRDFLRCVLERGLLGRGLDVVGINDLWDAATLAHLLEFDSTFGPLRWDVSHDDGGFTVGGHRIPVTGLRDPATLERGRLVLPQVAGRLDGVALRVPVENGSLSDLTCQLATPVTAAEVNEVFLAASRERLDGILRYTTKPIVSRDVVGDPASCIFDASLTQANGRLVKVLGWYDNEWGYTNRLVDLSLLFAA